MQSVLQGDVAIGLQAGLGIGLQSCCSAISLQGGVAIGAIHLSAGGSCAAAAAFLPCYVDKFVLGPDWLLVCCVLRPRLCETPDPSHEYVFCAFYSPICWLLLFCLLVAYLVSVTCLLVVIVCIGSNSVSLFFAFVQNVFVFRLLCLCGSVRFLVVRRLFVSM